MKQNLGIALITFGALGGSLLASLDDDSVPWLPFSACFAVGCAGVGLVRWASRQAATDPTLLQAHIHDVQTHLGRILEESRELAARTWDAAVYDLPDEIDRRFPESIGRFVAARESIRHVHGVHAYAEVMSDFAAGERYLNRVWSAAAEGYVDEAQTYLGKARDQFERANETLSAL